MRRRARERQEKRVDEIPILERLCAALLRSFRGSDGRLLSRAVIRGHTV